MYRAASASVRPTQVRETCRPAKLSRGMVSAMLLSGDTIVLWIPAYYTRG